MKFHMRELMQRLADLLETLVGLLLIAALAGALIGLVRSIKPAWLTVDPSMFSGYLSTAATLVIGVEFIKMLCSHTIDSVIEIMLLAIARQMIVEHTSPLENLIAVVSIAVLYLVRKYLYIPRLDHKEHPPIFGKPLFGRKDAPKAAPEKEESVHEKKKGEESNVPAK